MNMSDHLHHQPVASCCVTLQHQLDDLSDCAIQISMKKRAITHKNLITRTYAMYSYCPKAAAVRDA